MQEKESHVDQSVHYRKAGRNLVFLFDEKIVTSSVDPNQVKLPTGFSSRKQQQDVESDTSSSFSSLESEENLKARENWSGRLDFLLSCIGFAVGLGNIWRFPYLCYKSGGGAFLVPYTFFLVMCGLPLFFMEVSLGQFASLSPITIWRFTPLFKGVGYGMVIISGLVCIYYNIIMTWTFYYLFNSMRSTLPWSSCDQWWNTETCVLEITNETKANMSNLYANDSKAMTTASEEFWNHNVLEITGSLPEIGTIRWPLFGCLLLAWVVVFLCLCKGVKSSGKVVKVTATFPYLVLTILLIRGLTLPGAMEGIKFYLIPKFEKLFFFKTWTDAATQIFYSVGMAWGSLITMSSYNKFNNNVYKDAIIVPMLNCGTSVFAGLVIFSVLGFMSHTTGLPVEEVATEGPGLIFVVYPQAVAQMPLPQLWAILFFLMIFTIGLDSQFGMFETMTSAFIDEFPNILRKKKILFTGVMCIIEFVLGIPCVFQNGIYVLTLMDWYSSCFSLMLLSFTECILISWNYGIDRFVKDIELMIGYKPCCYWKVMWKFVTPFVILFIWCTSLYNMGNAVYEDYIFPAWAVNVGWALALCSIIPTPIVALIAICRAKGSLCQRIRKLMQPAANWGPALTADKERYIASLNQFERERYEAAQKNLDRRTYLQLKNTSTNCIYKEPVTSILIEQDSNNPDSFPLQNGAMMHSLPSAQPSHFSALLQASQDSSSNV